MAAPKWDPAHLYQPGAIVVPRANAPQAGIDAVDNGGFETGDLTDWSYVAIGGSATASVVASNPHTGVYAFYWPGAPGSGSEGGTECVGTSQDVQPVDAGQLVTATGWFKYNTTGDIDGSRAQMRLQWYDSGMNPIAVSQGTLIKGRGNNNKYKSSSVTGAAPSAGFVAAQFWVTGRGGKGHVYVDDITWNYNADPTPGLVYRAVQPDIGLSASVEPDWPGEPGLQVIDNEVVWEAMLATRIVYEAHPILVSGPTEPTWPTEIGGTVADNTISWEAISRHVQDENCPHSTVVTILASKVFAADKDIVAFCATANPLDWTSEKDAGYLPTGLQQANSNDMAVLAPYRSNLTAFNANCFQNWQVDPDPEAMSILDQMDGIGSTWPKAAVAVGNELFYLAAIGVRTVGIAGASTNLQAGDVGMPIDPMVAPYIVAAIQNDRLVLATYYPAAGQYWLAFPDIEAEGETPVFVYSMTKTGKVGAWTRYQFPFSVESFAQLADDLYVKHGSSISRITADVDHDEIPDGEGGAEQVNFPGLVQWAYLDFGSPGMTKMLESFDYIGLGQGPSISVGYDQRNLAAFTPAYLLDPDTLPGGPIPLPVAAPTFSVKLEFAGGASWRVQAVDVYLSPLGGQP